MYVWSVDREERVEGVSHYVIKQGTREIFYRTADLAYTRETVNGAVELAFARDLAADFKFKTLNGGIFSDWSIDANKQPVCSRRAR